MNDLNSQDIKSISEFSKTHKNILKSLNIKYNNIKDSSQLSDIFKDTNYQEIQFDGISIINQSILQQIPVYHKNLQIFSLCNCQLTDELAPIISQIIENSEQLKFLYLANNSFTDHGGSQIFKASIKAKQLELLNIQGNFFSKMFVNYFIQTFQEFKQNQVNLQIDIFEERTIRGEFAEDFTTDRLQTQEDQHKLEKLLDTQQIVLNQLQSLIEQKNDVSEQLTGTRQTKMPNVQNSPTNSMCSYNINKSVNQFKINTNKDLQMNLKTSISPSSFSNTNQFSEKNEVYKYMKQLQEIENSIKSLFDKQNQIVLQLKSEIKKNNLLSKDRKQPSIPSVNPFLKQPLSPIKSNNSSFVKYESKENSINYFTSAEKYQELFKKKEPAQNENLNIVKQPLKDNKDISNQFRKKNYSENYVFYQFFYDFLQEYIH